jgi:hypothetical protein
VEVKETIFKSCHGNKFKTYQTALKASLVMVSTHIVKCPDGDHYHLRRDYDGQ